MISGLAQEIVSGRVPRDESNEHELAHQVVEILDCLARVMSTLSKSAGSPEETAVWREANALLVMHGRKP